MPRRPMGSDMAATDDAVAVPPLELRRRGVPQGKADPADDDRGRNGDEQHLGPHEDDQHSQQQHRQRREGGTQPGAQGPGEHGEHVVLLLGRVGRADARQEGDRTHHAEQQHPDDRGGHQRGRQIHSCPRVQTRGGVDQLHQVNGKDGHSGQYQTAGRDALGVEHEHVVLQGRGISSL